MSGINIHESEQWLNVPAFGSLNNKRMLVVLHLSYYLSPNYEQFRSVTRYYFLAHLTNMSKNKKKKN